MQPLDVVVLAAGKGTRMKSATPKVLHALGGKPMLQHVIDTVGTLAPRSIQVVVGHGSDQVVESVTGVTFAIQAEQKGTGHAVREAAPGIGTDGVVLVVYGDVPLVSGETLQRCVSACRESHGVALVTALFEDPGQLGRIKRENDAIRAIVEYADASEAERALREINSGILCAPAEFLLAALDRLEPKNAQGEYYLTDVIADAVTHNVPVTGIVANSPDEVAGVNDRRELARLERVYQRQRVDELMRNGVTFADPARVDLRGHVSIGRDSYIDVNAVLIDVTLGEGVEIGPGAVIQQSTIGDGTQVFPHTVIEGSVIGEACKLGPFTRIRPASELSRGVKLGNFVEVKKTHMGEGAKANHLAYLGDASVGAKSNVGAGTVTCNYDGVNKFRTEIGEDAFIGTNSTLVAPLTIGREAYVAAGSTVTGNVADEELAVGRSRQRNIQGWVPPKKRKD